MAELLSGCVQTCEQELCDSYDSFPSLPICLFSPTPLPVSLFLSLWFSLFLRPRLSAPAPSLCPR